MAARFVLIRRRSTFPDLDALRRGEGVIQLRATAPFAHVSNGVHTLSFKNAHRRNVSVYLANALVPSDDRVAINAQHRDETQTDLTIEYTLRGHHAPATPLWPLRRVRGHGGAVGGRDSPAAELVGEVADGNSY